MPERPEVADKINDDGIMRREKRLKLYHHEQLSSYEVQYQQNPQSENNTNISSGIFDEMANSSVHVPRADQREEAVNSFVKESDNSSCPTTEVSGVDEADTTFSAVHDNMNMQAVSSLESSFELAQSASRYASDQVASIAEAQSELEPNPRQLHEAATSNAMDVSVQCASLAEGLIRPVPTSPQEQEEQEESVDASAYPLQPQATATPNKVEDDVFADIDLFECDFDRCQVPASTCDNDTGSGYGLGLALDRHDIRCLRHFRAQLMQSHPADRASKVQQVLTGSLGEFLLSQLGMSAQDRDGGHDINIEWTQLRDLIGSLMKQYQDRPD